MNVCLVFFYLCHCYQIRCRIFFAGYDEQVHGGASRLRIHQFRQWSGKCHSLCRIPKFQLLFPPVWSYNAPIPFLQSLCWFQEPLFVSFFCKMFICKFSLNHGSYFFPVWFGEVETCCRYIFADIPHFIDGHCGNASAGRQDHSQQQPARQVSILTVYFELFRNCSTLLDRTVEMELPTESGYNWNLSVLDELKGNDVTSFKQCWGSGSGRIACFWASRIRIISLKYGSGSFPFLIGVERTAIMLAE